MSSKNLSTLSVVRDFTDATIFHFLSSLNTPRSLTVWLLFSSGEHDQLVELTCKPLDYNNHAKYRDDYAATSLLSKADFLSTSFKREKVALDKFLKSEERCRDTNKQVSAFAPSGNMPPEALHPLIPRVRRQIRQILGSFCLEEMVDSSDWGPGVSTLLKGPYSVKPNKYQSETGMTQEVNDVIRPLLPMVYPSWSKEILTNVRISVEPGNIVTTVPKNSKTDRVIAIEPGWNLWFQKGIGTMIRRRLLRRGCNLNVQAHNQQLARVAVKRELATIDFSSASDTIASEVVRLLLPNEWFRILNLFRCRTGTLPDGSRVHWEKFSSMGNGYTFELESMIFYAIALVVSDSLGLSDDAVSVFGDDVIISQLAVPCFVELSELLGFKVNPEKSFTSGLFFESCGSHWFNSFDVKPFYLDKRIDTVSKCYSTHNRIVEYAHRCLDSNWGLDSRFKDVTKQLRSLVSHQDFNLVPLQFGDVGFFSNLDHALRLSTLKVIRMVGYKIRIRTEVAVKLHFDGYGLILDRIHGALKERVELGDRSPTRFMLKSLAKSFQKSLRSPSSKGLTSRRKGPYQPDMVERNLVPLKTTIKSVQRYPIVGAGQWYDFGPWF